MGFDWVRSVRVGGGLGGGWRGVGRGLEYLEEGDGKGVIGERKGLARDCVRHSSTYHPST